MRIIVFASGELWAGAEVMALHLLQCLASTPEIKLKAVLLNRGKLAEELRSAGIEIEIIDESQLSFFKIVLAIRSVFVSERPNIIHSHRYKENLLTFLATRFLKNIKLITTQHGLPENQKKRTSLSGKIKTKVNFYVLSRYFHKIITVSENINDYYTGKLKFNSKKMLTIHNGIEIIEKIPKKNLSDEFTIGSSGRLFPVKNYSLMVEVADLIAHHENIFFALAGDGPEKKTLEHSILQHNLKGCFDLVGHLENMELFYAGLDIYINTSLHEGIPMTILEAMAHGLPIIAPKVGGIPEIIEDGVEGFLIDSRDPHDYAEKCLLLYNDNELLQRMSVAAREKVCKEFTRERMADRYMECYRELLTL